MMINHSLKYPVIWILLFLSCNKTRREEEHIIMPGIGFDNIQLGKSSLEEIVQKFGNHYVIDTFYWQPPFKKEILSIRYVYSDLGISFYFLPGDVFVNSINMRFPCNVRTDKGIKLNKSTFKEIEDIYGEADWQYVGNDFLHLLFIQKTYAGISFMKKVDIEIPSPDSLLDKFGADKIEEIEINSSSGK